jgi:hypothetical protein
VSPITGFHQGLFELTFENGREVLRNSHGQELVGVREDRFVFAARPRFATRSTDRQGPAIATVTDVHRPAQPAAAAAEALQHPAAAGGRPVEELPARAALPASGKPAVSQPPAPAAPATARRDATPFVVLPREDDGTRMSLRGLLSQPANR